MAPRGGRETEIELIVYSKRPFIESSSHVYFAQKLNVVAS